MKVMNMLLACALLCLALTPAAAEDVFALMPVQMPAEAEAQELALYCGPTQGFYRHAGQTLDTGAPYVVFGQYDCWAMAAQGTAEAFGPVGWVEAGFLPGLESAAALGFDDSFAAMLEQDAPATNDPLADDPFAHWDAVLLSGTQVIVLAQLDGWLYVQAELEDVPARVFIAAETVF